MYKMIVSLLYVSGSVSQCAGLKVFSLRSSEITLRLTESTQRVRDVVFRYKH